MCTNTRTKLKEVENGMNCLYAELRSVKMDRDQAVKETKIAEDNYDRVCSRNMRLRETTDISILWMIFSFSVSAVLIGVLAYVL